MDLLFGRGVEKKENLQVDVKQALFEIDAKGCESTVKSFASVNNFTNL